jgi:hypothetical protein
MGAVVQGHLEDLRQVEDLAISRLGDLCAAAKAVRNDEDVLIRLADGREREHVSLRESMRVGEVAA